MQLQSSVFSKNGLIPTKYTCDGDNISPPLSWAESPANTASFVLIVEDPDAPTENFTHWLVYNIPADQNEILEGISTEATLPDGSAQGKNDFGHIGFGGPCPPTGSHRYCFRLHALERSLDLAPEANKADVLAAMQDGVLQSAELVGYYTR